MKIAHDGLPGKLIETPAANDAGRRNKDWTVALALRLQLPANSRLAKKAIQGSGRNIFFTPLSISVCVFLKHVYHCFN
ncbi:hypothetical protein [Massilia sp. BJB1822]|uniref:hypothetical protein n=1 Tax=Massilia sp. BJB1822 TaxID=2744470 RepID=UPI0015942EFB|nr:hypothetical protein [Massilia sp. BJB1822]NVE00176.1 hypothetical protein [Massilia sp. BJB1822]